MSFIVFVRQPKNINSSEKVRFVQWVQLNLSVFSSLQNYVKSGTDRITDWSSHIPDHKKYTRRYLSFFPISKFIFVGYTRKF